MSRKKVRVAIIGVGGCHIREVQFTLGIDEGATFRDDLCREKTEAFIQNKD